MDVRVGLDLEAVRDFRFEEDVECVLARSKRIDVFGHRFKIMRPRLGRESDQRGVVGEGADDVGAAPDLPVSRSNTLALRSLRQWSPGNA